MNNKIHPTAIISEKAIIGNNVEIGAYSVIEAATIADDVVIHSHVVVKDNVTLNRAVEVFPGALIGKVPKGAGALARQPEYDKKIIIGEECSIGPHAVIYYDVTIDNNTLIGDGASIREQCVIGSYCILGRYVTVNYNAKIGCRTKIMDNTNVTGNCVIGNNVFIGMMVGMANDNIIIQGYGAHVIGPIIEDNVFIGVGVSLLPAVRIGENAIVAAGSVVTKNVEANTKVVGVPARLFKVS